MPDHPATLKISDLYKRPLQVWRYLRQFPSPCSPNWSLLRQACLNSPHSSLRTGLWQVSRYVRQFPSPRSPRASLFSQARRNCSHCPPRPPRTPPGPISIDWEKAEIGITKRAAAAAAPNEYLRIPFNIPNPPVAYVPVNYPAQIHHAGKGGPKAPKLFVLLTSGPSRDANHGASPMDGRKLAGRHSNRKLHNSSAATSIVPKRCRHTELGRCSSLDLWWEVHSALLMPYPT
jgi:hypothetical protein